MKKIQFLICISHILSVQKPHVAGGYYIGKRRYSAFPSSQKVLLDSTGLDDEWGERRKTAALCKHSLRADGFHLLSTLLKQSRSVCSGWMRSPTTHSEL